MCKPDFLPALAQLVCDVREVILISLTYRGFLKPIGGACCVPFAFGCCKGNALVPALPFMQICMSRRMNLGRRLVKRWIT